MKKIDEEALADAYNRALSLEKSGDFDAAARAYAEVLALDPDDHGGAAVRLASMGRGDTPEKAPDAYVTTLFDQHAEVFDNVLVDQLGYCVPLLVRQRFQALGLGPFARVLDLGCGTGLMGEAIHEQSGFIAGCDLSPRMIERARTRGDYDELAVVELTAFLTGRPAAYDLIVSADTLIYFGQLEPVLTAAAAALRAGGWLAFTVERVADADASTGFDLDPSGRYRHSEPYLRQALVRAGLTIESLKTITLRLEGGRPVIGFVVMAGKNP